MAIVKLTSLSFSNEQNEQMMLQKLSLLYQMLQIRIILYPFYFTHNNMQDV